MRFIAKSLRKQDRPSHHSQDFFVPQFTEDRLLDPVRAIKLYLKRVRGRRGSLKSLFVTFGKGEVKTPVAQTLAHWIVDAIKESLDERDGGTIRAHSTRSVSTTVGLLRGVPLSSILKAADWSSECTFARHYLKEYRDRDGEFARSVLGSRS